MSVRQSKSDFVFVFVFARIAMVIVFVIINTFEKVLDIKIGSLQQCCDVRNRSTIVIPHTRIRATYRKGYYWLMMMNHGSISV